MTEFGDTLVAARHAAHEAGGRMILLAQTGSRAYGTHRPNSDHDFKGVYVASNRSMFLMRGPQRTINSVEPHDVTIYELAHFVKLAAAANPTVLEILWADEFEATPHLGERLRAARHLFLSKRILHTYGGYAVAQAKKAVDGTGGSRGAEHHKRFKFRLHTMRLLFAGQHALATGEVAVRLKPDVIAALRAQALVDDDLFQLNVALAEGIMQLAAEDSPLPEKPDEKRIDALVYSIRRDMESARVT